MAAGPTESAYSRCDAASTCARLTRARAWFSARRSRQASQRSSTFAAMREPPTSRGSISSKPTASAIPQSTHRPRSRHQTAKRTTSTPGFVRRGRSLLVEQRRTRLGEFVCLLRRAELRVEDDDAHVLRGSPSSSHQNRSAYHHQLRPSCFVTRIGRSACEVASRANRCSEHSRWCCAEWRRKTFTPGAGGFMQHVAVESTQPLARDHRLGLLRASTSTHRLDAVWSQRRRLASSSRLPVVVAVASGDEADSSSILRTVSRAIRTSHSARSTTTSACARRRRCFSARLSCR